MHHALFTHSPTEGHLGYFHLLVTMTKAALNIQYLELWIFLSVEENNKLFSSNILHLH